MRAYDRWRALPPIERRLTAEAAGLVAMAVVGLRLRGVQRMLRGARRDVSGTPAAPSEIRDRVMAVDRASRYVPGATCLPRAIALAWMLRGRGIAAIVRLGARSETGRFQAHAWVEYDGIALNDPELAERYAPLS